MTSLALQFIRDSNADDCTGHLPFSLGFLNMTSNSRQIVLERQTCFRQRSDVVQAASIPVARIVDDKDIVARGYQPLLAQGCFVLTNY
jgi:hypothetical protein